MKTNRVWLGFALLLAGASLLLRPTGPAAGRAGDWVPLPPDLRLPDGTGAPLPLPTLAPSGPPLIVSNSPEQIAPFSGGAVALDREQPGAARFRLFFHHQNVTGRSLQAGFAVSNLSSSRPVQVYVARNSQDFPPGVTTNDRSPALAGRRALLNWCVSRHGAPDAPGQDQFLGTLAPGASRLFTQPLRRQETLTGQYDLAVRFEGSAGGAALPAVAVTTLAYSGGPPSAPRFLPLASPDPPASLHCRGLFLHADRRGRVDFTITPDGVPQWLDLSGPVSGAFSRPIPGEYEPSAQATLPNNGNYGVVYDLDVSVTNPLPFPVKVHGLLNMAGGDGSSVLLVGEAVRSGPPVLKAAESWVFKELTLAPGGTNDFRLRYTLPGGSNGAHRLFFWPERS